MSATTPSPTASTDGLSGSGTRALPGRWAVLGLVAWTAFVWVGRIRNALADDALDAGGRTGPVLLSASFLLLAAAAAVLVALRWSRSTPGGALLAVVGVLAAWSTAVWVVRLVDIIGFGDHDVGFVVVHAVLGVVSIALSVLAVLNLRKGARPGV